MSSAARSKDWRKQNPGKRAAYNREYYSRPEVKERRRERQRQYRIEQPGRAEAYMRAWHTANPDYHHRRLGYPAPTRPRPELCECCGERSSRKLHLDHDHSTGNFRGWLCQQCNHGLGLFGDTIAGLQNAIRYLTNAQ